MKLNEPLKVLEILFSSSSLRSGRWTWPVNTRMWTITSNWARIFHRVKGQSQVWQPAGDPVPFSVRKNREKARTWGMTSPYDTGERWSSTGGRWLLPEDGLETLQVVCKQLLVRVWASCSGFDWRRLQDGGHGSPCHCSNRHHPIRRTGLSSF